MSGLLQRLVAETGLTEFDVRHIMLSAPRRYKTYSIPKKKGGYRLISQPAREIKILQRAMCELMLNNLPVHRSATAYVRGKSIADNAWAHANAGPILKMDLKDFFPSIRAKDWISYCNENNLLSDEEIYLSASLLFKRARGDRYLSLSIGAPSSPVLSNVLMYDFDTTIINMIDDDRVIYTRYADDLTFSAPRAGFLKDVKRDVARTIRVLRYPKLEINDSKTVFATKRYHRGVTGLTLTNEGLVSLGHERKRSIHAAVFNASRGRLTDSEKQELCGMLAFVNAVEPEFLEVLRRRYGAGIIQVIQRFVLSTKAPGAS